MHFTCGTGCAALAFFILLSVGCFTIRFQIPSISLPFHVIPLQTMFHFVLSSPRSFSFEVPLFPRHAQITPLYIPFISIANSFISLSFRFHVPSVAENIKRIPKHNVSSQMWWLNAHTLLVSSRTSDDPGCLCIGYHVSEGGFTSGQNCFALREREHHASQLANCIGQIEG